MSKEAAWLLFRAAIALGLHYREAIHHVAQEAWADGYARGYAAGRNDSHPHRKPANDHH